MKFNRDLEVRVMSQQENHIVFISYSQDSLSLQIKYFLLLTN